MPLSNEAPPSSARASRPRRRRRRRKWSLQSAEPARAQNRRLERASSRTTPVPTARAADARPAASSNSASRRSWRKCRAKCWPDSAAHRRKRSHPPALPDDRASARHGLVEIPVELFWSAFPPLLKHHFLLRDDLTISLPLEEIFQNLPVGGTARSCVRTAGTPAMRRAGMRKRPSFSLPARAMTTRRSSYDFHAAPRIPRWKRLAPNSQSPAAEPAAPALQSDFASPRAGSSHRHGAATAPRGPLAGRTIVLT